MYDLEDVTEEKQKFVCDSDLKAEWLIKKIKENEAECERLTSVINQEIELLQSKKEKLQNDLNNKNGWLKGKLIEYFDTVEKRETKTQLNYKLPSGTLTYIKPSFKYEHNDEQILQYLRDNDKFEYIKVEHKLKWQELKKNEDLEKIEGVTRVETPARFEVK